MSFDINQISDELVRLKILTIHEDSKRILWRTKVRMIFGGMVTLLYVVLVWYFMCLGNIVWVSVFLALIGLSVHLEFKEWDLVKRLNELIEKTHREETQDDCG